MSFPHYSKYKDSGVEWLGKVPEHWRLVPLKHIASLKGRLGWQGLRADEYTEDGPFLVTSEHFSNGRVDWHRCYHVSPERYEIAPAIQLRSGDVLLMKDGSIGKLAYIDALPGAACLNSHLLLIRPLDSTLESRFIYYLLSSAEFNCYAMREKTGTTFHGISQETVASFVLAAPTTEEQSEICEFLDREVARLEVLVEQQRRLIELLQEKRDAVISHAVTKGLNPTASLQPSGIDWYGDIPAHWKLGKCRFYTKILAGFAFPSSGFSLDETQPKLLRGINVGVGRIKWDEVAYWPRVPDDGLSAYELIDGDIVIGMDRPVISEGVRVAKVSQSDLPCLLLQRVCSIKTSDALNRDYLFALLSSDMFVAYFSPDTTGISVPHISPTQIADFMIPIPPRIEQDEIVHRIVEESFRFDQLIEEANRATDLLQERRSALISAAVTGKIDVRQAVLEPVA